jgi:hypothetical protein
LTVTQPQPLCSPVASGWLGLYSASDFAIATGPGDTGATIRQALWYFEHETVAMPRAGLPIAGFTRGIATAQDVVRWGETHAPGTPIDYPPLIWIAAPQVVHGARLSADGSSLTAGVQSWAFDVVPKFPLNRSYYDAASIAFLAARPLSVRGTNDDGRFIARTIWPEDFRLDVSAPARDVPATTGGLRRLVREEPKGGTQSPFAAMTLWERTPGVRNWQDKAVLAVMLNGAQGDDDEAHGGHFALVTGRIGDDGAINGWLANNFYTLDAVSEKGIIAAMAPLDNYLADLNSGQAWYRPSYLLVAVLSSDRTASHVQGALERVYNQFYRHQLVYQHAAMNCAGITVDVLRALGWNVPARGATSRALAWLGLPYIAVRKRSLGKAIEVYDYLTEDRTRLLPAAAFEEIGADLLRLASGRFRRRRTPFEVLLAQDIDALAFLRVPQLPSSRAWGSYPVVTTREYTSRLPSDPAKRQIIPVPARPFPERLRDPDLLPPAPRRGEVAATVWGLLGIVGIPWLISRVWRRRKPHRAPG